MGLKRRICRAEYMIRTAYCRIFRPKNFVVQKILCTFAADKEIKPKVIIFSMDTIGFCQAGRPQPNLFI